MISKRPVLTIFFLTAIRSRHYWQSQRMSKILTKISPILAYLYLQRRTNHFWWTAINIILSDQIRVKTGKFIEISIQKKSFYPTIVVLLSSIIKIISGSKQFTMNLTFSTLCYIYLFWTPILTFLPGNTLDLVMARDNEGWQRESNETNIVHVYLYVGTFRTN